MAFWKKLEAESLREVDKQALLSELRDCERIWRNIACFHNTSPDPKVVKALQIRTTRAKIEVAIARLDAPSGVIGEEPADKRARRRSPPRTKQTTVAQIEQSLDFDAGESPLLKFLDAPSTRGDKPAAMDLVALATGEALSPAVVDSYLKMLGEFSNRPSTDGARAGSPQWHMMSPWVMQVLNVSRPPRVSWPPQGYPEARFRETGHHVLPLYLEKEKRWGMTVLSNSAGWRLDFYASLTTHTDRLRREWPTIAEWGQSKFHDSGMDNVQAFEPEQPQDEHDQQSGVFMLSVVRWLVMGWPLDTLTSASAQYLRRLFAAELDKGNIISKQ